MDNFEQELKKLQEAEQLRVEAEKSRVSAEAAREHSESNQGTGRVEHEEERVEAEEGRVEESLGRKEAEEMRQEAEKVRLNITKQYESELIKLQQDPEHYITPGAKKYFRRVWQGYAVLAAAIVVGLFLQEQEGDNRVEAINKSRAQITYTTCLDTNDRHENTVRQLDNLSIQRKETLRRGIIETDDPVEQSRLRAQIDAVDDGRASSVSLINALVPLQNCEQLTIDRFGFVPDLNGGGE